MRRWVRELGLPDRVFGGTPVERKPFYVDLTSPALVNMLARRVRDAARRDGDGLLVLSEMCPDLDELWLTDSDGASYTCEFRLVVSEHPGRVLPSPSGPDGRAGFDRGTAHSLDAGHPPATGGG
jgi:hypothetical protein